MWEPETVERALFKCQQWRRSIIRQWASPSDWAESFSQDQLQNMAMMGVQTCKELGLTGDYTYFILYWNCCVSSDYNIEYPISFDNILVPSWIAASQIWGYSKGGTRALPPRILNEGDVRFEKRSFPWITEKRLLFHSDMFLPRGHGFYPAFPKNYTYDTLIIQNRG